MTIYNPFLGAWLTGPDGQDFARFSTFQGIVPINQLLRGTFLAHGVAVADVEGAFSTTDFTTMVSLPGVGSVPLNVARICLWTWICAPSPLGPDNHANAAGYGGWREPSPISSGSDRALLESCPDGSGPDAHQRVGLPAPACPSSIAVDVPAAADRCACNRRGHRGQGPFRSPEQYAAVPTNSEVSAPPGGRR